MSNEFVRTGTDNATYDLTSVLYHALQGVQTAEQYIRDAEDSGDQDLLQFFRDLQQQQKAQADRAKTLLARRMH
jgi:hypothetical protein